MLVLQNITLIFVLDLKLLLFFQLNSYLQNVGKVEVAMVDVGDIPNGRDMIKISRRNAYLSSEGTAVFPSTTPLRESLRAILLEMFSKPPAEREIKEDEIVQVKKRNRLPFKGADEL